VESRTESEWRNRYDDEEEPPLLLPQPLRLIQYRHRLDGEERWRMKFALEGNPASWRIKKAASPQPGGRRAPRPIWSGPALAGFFQLWPTVSLRPIVSYLCKIIRNSIWLTEIDRLAASEPVWRPKNG
jgi:hypothetical protein